MTVTHIFANSLKESHAQEAHPLWHEVYGKAFPTMVHSHSTRDMGWAQLGGVDRSITLKDGTVIEVDEKVRKDSYHRARSCPECKAKRGHSCVGQRPCIGRTDILIEYWSDERRKKPGWGNLNKKLRCDYIAYLVLPNHTCYLLPYEMLRRAIQLNQRAWLRNVKLKVDGYGRVPAYNRGERGNKWTTISYTVPTDVLLDAIRDCLIITWDGRDNG